METRNFVYENHLLFELSPENFQIIDLIPKKTDGKLMKAIYNGDKTKYYAIKVLTFNTSETDKKLELQKEIKTLEKIQNIKIKPDSIAQFYGFFQKFNEKKNEIEYSLVFDYYEYSLKDLLEKKELLTFENIYNIYKSLINCFAFLQSHLISHKCLKPENIMINAANKIKINGYGLVKDIEDYYQKQVANSFNEHEFYVAPEILKAFNKKNIFDEKINFFKNVVYSFGLIILEIGTMKIIQKNGDVDGLAKEIEKNFIQFKKNYINKLISNDDKTKFEKLLNKLNLSLSLNPDMRPDFLRIFSDSIIEDPLNYQKIAIHTIIDEFSLDSLVETLENSKLQNPDLKSKINELELENSRLKQKVCLLLEENKEISLQKTNKK